MLAIRKLHADDLPLAMQLSSAAGWNQTRTDWNRFLSLAPVGCFAASVDQRLVGTVTTCQFGEVGWIGMMLVHSQRRRQGIGRSLLQNAVDHLESRGATTIRLDATPAGVPLYRAFAFHDQFLLHRYTGIVTPSDVADCVHECQSEHLQSLVSLDQRFVGYDRQPLLDALRLDPQHRSLVMIEGADVVAYGMSRPGSRAVFIGPCIAECDAAGSQTLKALLQNHVGEQVYVDIPEVNQTAITTVMRLGLVPDRPLLRMVRGPAHCEAVNGLFASSGPEKG